MTEKDTPSGIPILTCALIAVFVGMRMWRLSDISLDGDEIFSVLLARRNWPDLLAGAVQDAIHPPLFYALLKIWIRVGGESLLSLRLFPVAASTLCLIPFFLLCRNLGISPAARNLAVAIASVHPYALFYAQHVRMYCLLTLGGLIAILCFQRYLHEPSNTNLVSLTAANLFVVYAQYYGWLIVGLEFLYLVWRQRRRLTLFVYSSLLVGVVFSPWAWVAIRSLRGKGGLAQNLGWISRPSVQDMCWFFVDMTGFAEFPKLGVWGALCVLAFLILAYRGYTQVGVHWLTWICLTPAPLAFLACQWLPQSIWGHRHLVFTMWPFLAVFSDSVSRLRRMARAIVLGAIGVWAGFAVAFHSTDDRKLPWDALTLAMLAEERSGNQHIPFYSLDPYLHFPIWFYLDCLKNRQMGPLGPRLAAVHDPTSLTPKAAQFDVLKIGSVDAALGQYFWVGYADSSWHDTRKPGQVLEERGCRSGPEITARDRLHSVTLMPFWCPNATHGPRGAAGTV